MVYFRGIISQLCTSGLFIILPCQIGKNIDPIFPLCQCVFPLMIVKYKWFLYLIWVLGNELPWQVYLSGQMRCLQRQCQKANLHKQIQCLQRHSHHSNSKYICFIYLKSGSWFSRPWFSFSESNYPRSWIGKHRIWPSICPLAKPGVVFASNELWQPQYLLLGCSSLKPINAHLRFRRMYGIVFIPAMRQRKE